MRREAASIKSMTIARRGEALEWQMDPARRSGHNPATKPPLEQAKAKKTKGKAAEMRLPGDTSFA